MVFDQLFPGATWGVHRLPREGAFLLAANHASYFDPPAIGCRVPRAICYLARKTLFKPGPVDRILRSVSAIPVDRDGDSDIGAMKQVLARLKNGKPVIFFPEGTRTPDGNIQPAKAGMGMIACRARVPVVPVRIFGSYEAFPKGASRPKWGTPIDVHFGPPLLPEDYDPGGRGKDRYQESTDRIMAAIRELPRPR